MGRASVALLPLNAEHARQVVGEDRLMQLRKRHGRAVHRTGIKRAPFAVEHRHDLVADDDVGVQVRIGCPAVVVVVGGRHDPGDIDLCNRATPAGCARAGCCHFALHERNNLCNRVMVGLSDQRLGAAVRNSPQCRRGFRDREREVKPRHRPPFAFGLLVGGDRLHHR